MGEDGTTADPTKADNDHGFDAPKGSAAARWFNRLVLLLVLVGLGFLAYFVVTVLGPRWWSHRVGDEVVGGRARGVLYGFGVGAFFTFLPVLILAQARRGFMSWSWRGITVLAAVALALPNWLTLAVAAGSNQAAQDAREIMTRDAPGFRNGSAAGAIFGLLIALLVVGTSMRLGHQRRTVKALRGRVSELEKRHFVGVKNDEPALAQAPADEPRVVTWTDVSDAEAKLERPVEPADVPAVPPAPPEQPVVHDDEIDISDRIEPV